MVNIENTLVAGRKAAVSKQVVETVDKLEAAEAAGKLGAEDILAAVVGMHWIAVNKFVVVKMVAVAGFVDIAYIVDDAAELDKADLKVLASFRKVDNLLVDMNDIELDLMNEMKVAIEDAEDHCNAGFVDCNNAAAVAA